LQVDPDSVGEEQYASINNGGEAAAGQQQQQPNPPPPPTTGGGRTRLSAEEVLGDKLKK
jgi:hypothetical protein